MTINLTELRDEPLGKHPIQAAYCYPNMCYVGAVWMSSKTLSPPTHESSFTFDVDGLSDEALDRDARFVRLSCCVNGCSGLC